MSWEGTHTPEFQLVADYQPTGDQPDAIDKLTEGVVAGAREQTLLGVTGSGKTFTMANIIQRVQRPALPVRTEVLEQTRGNLWPET